MKHEFCTFCGKKLETRFTFSHYDARNGEKLYSNYFTCPARRWWNAFLHDTWLVRGGSFGSSPQYYTESYIQRIHDTCPSCEGAKQVIGEDGTVWVCGICGGTGERPQREKST